MHFVGRFAPAGPILHVEMVLPSFPVETAAEPNQILPPLLPIAIVADPRTLHLMMVLFVASPWKRIVEVPDVAETVVLEIVRALPPLFKPLIVILSAPLKSINGSPAVAAPAIVQLPPDGCIIILAQSPAPNTTPPAGSDVLAVTDIVILAEVCTVPIATVAAERLAYVPLPDTAPLTVTCACKFNEYIPANAMKITRSQDSDISFKKLLAFSLGLPIGRVVEVWYIKIVFSFDLINE